MTTGWSFADLWEVCAGVRGSAPAQIHGKRVESWTQLDERANGLAQTLLDGCST